MRPRALVGTLLAAALLVTPLPAASASAVASSAACTWRGTPLPVPAGVTIPEISATDDAGGFSGTVYRPESRVVGWKNGSYVDYGKLYSMLMTVADQNRSGTIVGSGMWGMWAMADRPFVSSGGALTELPLPGDFPRGRALGVTDAGDITGYVWSSPTTSGYTTVRWPAGRPSDVAPLPGMPRTVSVPRAADRDGAVVFLDDATGWYAVWRNGVTRPLAKLSGLGSVTVNDMQAGRIVGTGVYNGKSVGVYWDETGAAHVLPRSSSHAHPNANPKFAINGNGLIVGRVDAANGGDDTKGTGYGVWDKGAWVSTFGDPRSDLPAVVGDDGTVGGSRIEADGTPRAYTWRCS